MLFHTAMAFSIAWVLGGLVALTMNKPAEAIILTICAAISMAAAVFLDGRRR